MSFDQRLGDLVQKIAYLTEVTNCLACPPDNQIIQNNLLGKASNLDILAQSCLKTQPKVLFRHTGKVTHHIGPVGSKYLIARANMQSAEIRHIDSGREIAKIAIQGLNCSFDHQERLYCGTQFKKLIAVSSRSFKVIGQVSTQGSVNSISLGFHPNTLILGQTNGYVCFVKINADREDATGGKQN